MKDSEFNSFNEFNNFKEQNKSMGEAYTPFEVKKTLENYDTKEDNDGKSTKASEVAIPKISFKDRIVESTAPIRTIVSAATCTVAATAVTTTFLVNPPKVTDIDLVCGNDYVSYSLSVDDLDIDRSYMIEVSNPKFSFTDVIDVTKANDYNMLSGVITGLKPNYKYDFKLLKDNGEVGGYLPYYTKSFYTEEVPNPTCTFEFELDGENITYKSIISDYYDLLSDSYLSISLPDETLDYPEFA